MGTGKPSGRPKKIHIDFNEPEENEMAEPKVIPPYDELIYREGLQVAMRTLDVRHPKNLPAACELAEAYLLVIKTKFPK